MSIQDMAHGIIREYLKLHNYKEAYEAFEQEAMRRGIPKLFSKRLEMLEAVGITAQFREEFEKKKKGVAHLETSLEVLIKSYKETSVSEEKDVTQPRRVRRKRSQSIHHTTEETAVSQPEASQLETLLHKHQPSEGLNELTSPHPIVSLKDYLASNGGFSLFNSVLFGVKRQATIPDTWYQSFFCLSLLPKTKPKKTNFSVLHPRSWAIHQREGGPCGIIAVIQARMAKYLFYGAKPHILASTILIQALTIGLQNLAVEDIPVPFIEAVLSAIYETLELALKQSPTGCVYVVVPLTHRAFTRDFLQQLSSITPSDIVARQQLLRDIHERLGLTRIVEEMDDFEVITASSLVEIKDILSSLFYQFYAITTFPSSFIPAFVVSMILTRTLREIATTDFDSSNDAGSVPNIGLSSDSLFTNMNNASMELLNLFIHGRAVAGTHDGVITCDGFTLKGVDTPTDIGLLSIYEYYNYLTIGNNLKWGVLYPCFVLFNEAHYTCLFPIDKASMDIISTGLADRMFVSRKEVDMIYSDSLDDQSESVRLTLVLEGPVTCKREEDGVVDKSFVNQLIYTLFGASIVSISWNGTEPYL
ncbi:Hypothetical protein GLP15_1523 [Giardia lamblia P15]|uniref:Probable ubiquitin carboxyl-terminal hydrolase MINDY-4 n=1 Tax=Giardia intestinalis (strain P15) TaxID=658858 RepID=E1EYL8_GIAIA|nr:Hypothetical protein GLP15_1523 [Giardia lamblia P15]